MPRYSILSSSEMQQNPITFNIFHTVLISNSTDLYDLEYWLISKNFVKLPVNWNVKTSLSLHVHKQSHIAAWFCTWNYKNAIPFKSPKLNSIRVFATDSFIKGNSSSPFFKIYRQFNLYNLTSIKKYCFSCMLTVCLMWLQVLNTKIQPSRN